MENRQSLRICLSLILVVFAAYFPIMNCDFVNYDDASYIYNNSHVNTGLTPANVLWAWTSFDAANWHPLTWMSLQLDCQLFGLKPRPPHVVNLGWHIASTLFLYLVLRRMTGEDWRPALVAALFGLHPLHVESVAWVSERKDVTSTFFAIVTLGAYTLYAARPSFARYLAVAAFFVLGLLCKPMLVTWPCVLLLMDYWPLRRTPLLPADTAGGTPRFAAAGWGRLVLEKLPLLALAVASSLVTMQAQVIAMKPGERLALGFRLANALVSYATYLRKMVWPMDLAPFYWHYGSTLPATPVIVSATVLVLLSLAALLGYRRHPALLVGWLWYLGTLVPVLGIVQVGLQSMADRYTYIPLIGIFLALAWSIPVNSPLPRFGGEGLGVRGQTAAEKHPLTPTPLPRFGGEGLSFATTVMLSGVLIFCAVLTFRQTQIWHDSEALWLQAVRAAESPITHSYYAGALYAKAQELYDDADELSQKGRAAQAERLIAEAKARVAEAERQCELALEMGIPFAPGYAQLGEYQFDRCDLEGALAIFSQGIETDPRSGGLYDRLGRVLAYMGRIEEASRQFREACRLEPEAAPSHFDLGTALALLGKREEAEREWELGRKLEPEFTEQMRKYAESFLGHPRARRYCPEIALFHAQEACWSSSTPQAELYQILAQSYAAAGQPIAAHTHAQRALDLAEANGQTDLLPPLRQLCSTYAPAARRQEEARAAVNALTSPTLFSLPAVIEALAVLQAERFRHDSFADR